MDKLNEILDEILKIMGKSIFIKGMDSRYKESGEWGKDVDEAKKAILDNYISKVEHKALLERAELEGRIDEINKIRRYFTDSNSRGFHRWAKGRIKRLKNANKM